MSEFILIVFLIGFAIVVIRLFSKKANKPIEAKNYIQVIGSENENINAYQLYSDWCQKQNEMPITRNEFEKLANSQGSINLADVMDKHRNINTSQKEEDIAETKNNSTSDYEERLQKEKDEQKKRDEKFVGSAIIGYVTNSTTKGTLLGGSLLGGLFGDYLNKKPKKHPE